MKKFLYIYALAFSMIWIGYGVYSIITKQPSATLVLGIGIAFSIGIFATTWLSSWLISYYRKVDGLAKKILSKNN